MKLVVVDDFMILLAPELSSQAFVKHVVSLNPTSMDLKCSEYELNATSNSLIMR